jgi:hypothetical protein
VNGIYSCGLPACCCQPAVAGGVIYADLRGDLNTHLALQALFTQSSPVCKTLLQAFSFPSTLGEVTLHLLSQACVFVYSSQSGASPLPVEFSSLRHSHKLSCSWLLGSRPHSCRSLSGQPGLFIYSSGKDSLPPIFGAQGAPPSFPFVFIVLIAYFSVSLFFPGWRSVCAGGYAALAQGCLWEYHSTAKLTLSVSSQAVWARVTGGPGALLVSLFNMKWRCSAPAGGVEGSTFCLFSVVLPARCVSSVSPRFHYRRHFLLFPLATILESLHLSNF